MLFLQISIYVKDKLGNIKNTKFKMTNTEEPEYEIGFCCNNCFFEGNILVSETRYNELKALDLYEECEDCFNCQEAEESSDESESEEEEETCKYPDGVPKWTLEIKCRCCKERGWYENIRDDFKSPYYDGKPNYKNGICAECADCESHPPYYCDGGCGQKMGGGYDHDCQRKCDECESSDESESESDESEEEVRG